jgi:putative membrane protein
MIEYDAKGWVSMVFRWRGAVYGRLLGRVALGVGLGVLAASLFESRGFKIPNVAHTLIGVALGLLLVFRTNASYDRYWEGRKLLGAMVNRSRDLTRQVATLVEASTDSARADQITLVRHVNLFYRLCAQTLRSERELNVLVGPWLLEHEERALEPVAARAPAVLGWISARLAQLARQGQLSELRLTAMDANVTALQDALGGCERIVRTPIPFAYAQHIKGLVSLFVFTAPFALVEAMKWHTPFAMAALSFALFGIDEIGIEIEDPFGYDPNDLPIERIGEGIANATTEVLTHSGALVVHEK